MVHAISSPENIKNLQLIKFAKIVDPSADIDLSGCPQSSVMHSIHGNEASGANATPLLAYYLAAVKELFICPIKKRCDNSSPFSIRTG